MHMGPSTMGLKRPWSAPSTTSGSLSRPCASVGARLQSPGTAMHNALAAVKMADWMLVDGCWRPAGGSPDFPYLEQAPVQLPEPLRIGSAVPAQHAVHLRVPAAAAHLQQSRARCKPAGATSLHASRCTMHGGGAGCRAICYVIKSLLTRYLQQDTCSEPAGRRNLVWARLRRAARHRSCPRSSRCLTAVGWPLCCRGSLDCSAARCSAAARLVRG